MTYKKAQDILPSHLIDEVQKYLDGGLVYFPKKTERRKWGSANGTQLALHKRNQEIKALYAEGSNYETLSRRFCLSEDSIRKIVSGKNNYK